MKKNVALVLSGTSNLVSGIASVIINAEEKSPGFIDDVIVFHDEISESDQKAINKYRKVEFRKFDNILTQTKKTAQSNYFGFLCYGIFEIFDLLDHYHHVIYLDSDVVIKKDFSNIVKFGPIAMLNAGRNIYDCFKTPPQGVDSNFNTRNSGVIVVNDKLDYKGLTQYCYEKTLEQWDNNTFADQSMLSYCLHLKKIKPFNLPGEYNKLYGKDSNDIIVHCINGDKKQWNNIIVNKLHHEWNNYYNTWLGLGGSPFSGVIHNKFFNDVNFQSNADSVVMARAYLKYIETTLEKTHFKLLTLLNTSFVRTHKNQNLPIYYYEFSKSETVRFELFVRGICLYLKIYTNSDLFKSKIKEDYSKKLTDFKAFEHANKSVSFHKVYPLINLIEKSESIPDIIFSDAKRLFQNTLLKETF